MEWDAKCIYRRSRADSVGTTAVSFHNPYTKTHKICYLLLTIRFLYRCNYILFKMYKTQMHEDVKSEVGCVGPSAVFRISVTALCLQNVRYHKSPNFGKTEDLRAGPRL
jgi:hypothetical protein